MIYTYICEQDSSIHCDSNFVGEVVQLFSFASHGQAKYLTERTIYSVMIGTF